MMYNTDAMNEVEQAYKFGKMDAGYESNVEIESLKLRVKDYEALVDTLISHGCINHAGIGIINRFFGFDKDK